MRLVTALLLLGCRPALSWDYASHRTVALTAYSQLKPKVRERVDALVRRHPDYARWAAGTAAQAFAEFAVFPDLMRGDERFHQPDKPATPKLAGFPDMLSHAEWHYINLPLARVAGPAPPAGEPNIRSALERLLRSEVDMYVLMWLSHLIADAHSPVHAVNYFSSTFPDGDRGGNEFDIIDDRAKNLHVFWDRVLPRGATLAKTRVKFRSPKEWALESHQLARDVVYTIQPGSRISSEYRRRAESAAQQRLAAAASRLAEWLNRRLD